MCLECIHLWWESYEHLAEFSGGPRQNNARKGLLFSLNMPHWPRSFPPLRSPLNTHPQPQYLAFTEVKKKK